MSQNSTKIIVFDFDGTLVDSMGDFTNEAAQIISRHYQKDLLWAKKAYRETSGLPFQFQLEKLFPKNLKNKNANDDFIRYKKERYGLSPFFENLESTLVWFKKNNFITAISSNNEEELLKEKLGQFTFLFDDVLGFRENFSKGKNHFDFLKQKYGVSSSSLFFVGDSLHDGKVAVENAVFFIAKVGTFTNEEFKTQGIAKFTIDNLKELTLWKY